MFGVIDNGGKYGFWSIVFGEFNFVCFGFIVNN